MSTEKRWVLFLVLSISMILGSQVLMDRLGLLPKPPKRQPAQDAPAAVAKVEPGRPGAAAEDADAAAAKEPARVAEAEAESKAEAAPPVKAAPRVDPDELVLGSATDKTPGGYRLEARFDQVGAGVAALISSRYEADHEGGKPRGRPLPLIEPDAAGPASFALESVTLMEAKPGEGEANGEAAEHEPTHGRTFSLDALRWEVVRDAQGRYVTPVLREQDGSEGPVEVGQQISFRTAVGDPPLTVTKTFRLLKGRDELEMVLGFQSPDEDRTVAYRLIGPHGLPIEGEWYTTTFRDAFFGMVKEGGVEVVTRSGYDVVKHQDDPERFQTLPLKYFGVENQYFAVLLEPKQPEYVAEARGIVIDEGKDKQKADISILAESRPVEVGPNRAKAQTYRIFAGPKTVEALAAHDLGAEELATYRKGWSLWVIGDLGASWMAKHVISGMLDRIYLVTKFVANQFGWSRGNYGIAIILLTMTVRLVLFPLSRKQAVAAKKMQDLQPLMKELKEKYQDDKERMTRETFALYKQYGVNPMGGCLPAIIQLPILIGLWQALNNSVALRHSSFLWIDNLAAPDMLFRFPFDMMSVPFIGHYVGPYFNLLPLVVVGLMLVQTKLFSPPATTPEQEQQQKMMKFMMIFMMFIFYKVPSGLGFYFITSSLWQLGERLLLPRVLPTPTVPVADLEGGPDRGASGGGKGGSERGGPGGGGGPGKGGDGSGGGWWNEAKSRARRRLEQLMDEAAHERTIRNPGEGDGNRGRERDRGRDRDRGRSRPRPDRRH